MPRNDISVTAMPTKGWPRDSVLGGWGGAARGGSAGVALAVGRGLVGDRRGSRRQGRLPVFAGAEGRRPRAMNAMTTLSVPLGTTIDVNDN